MIDGSEHTVGEVAQDSRIFARHLEDQGALFVKWGAAASGQCKIDYVLPKSTDKAGAPYLSVEGHCVSELHEVTPMAARVDIDGAAASSNTFQPHGQIH